MLCERKVKSAHQSFLLLARVTADETSNLKLKGIKKGVKVGPLDRNAANGVISNEFETVHRAIVLLESDHFDVRD